MQTFIHGFAAFAMTMTKGEITCNKQVNNTFPLTLYQTNPTFNDPGKVITAHFVWQLIELEEFPKQQFSDSFKLKEFEDINLKYDENGRKFFKR